MTTITNQSKTSSQQKTEITETENVENKLQSKTLLVIDPYQTFLDNFELPPLTIWEHGKSLQELYDFLLNPCVTNKLSKRIIKNCDSMYDVSIENVREAIKIAVGCAWKIRKEEKEWADKAYNSSDDCSSDSDDTDVYCGNRGPSYPPCVDEIEGSYRDIAQFLFFTLSIPPIDMCLRNFTLYGVNKGGCFCPFCKNIGRFLEWFPKDKYPPYRFLLEKNCNKVYFATEKNLLAHCDCKGDWYHAMYATF